MWESAKVGDIFDWRLITGHRPTIRYKVNPIDNAGTIHESRFFPNAPDMIYLHAHSGSSPYLPSQPSGFDIDIYQDVTCPVRLASLSIDWGSSLAKMVTRYRMAALAWIIGWVAHLIFGSITFVELTGEYLLTEEWTVLKRRFVPVHR